MEPIQTNNNFSDSVNSFDVNTSQQYKVDNNILNQFPASQQDNGNQFSSQNGVYQP